MSHFFSAQERDGDQKAKLDLVRRYLAKQFHLKTQNSVLQPKCCVQSILLSVDCHWSQSRALRNCGSYFEQIWPPGDWISCPSWTAEITLKEYQIHWPCADIGDFQLSRLNTYNLAHYKAKLRTHSVLCFLAKNLNIKKKVLKSKLYLPEWSLDSALFPYLQESSYKYRNIYV